MKFGDLLRQRREAAGVKIRQLARELKVSHTYLIAIEQGRKPPSERVFAALVNSLSINYDTAVFYLAQLRPYAKKRMDTEPGFVALVNLIALECSKSDLRKVAYFVETEIK